jgi:hypothetical protein
MFSSDSFSTKPSLNERVYPRIPSAMRAFSLLLLFSTLIITAEPAAASKSKMCANRLVNCQTKCDATNKVCREVCTTIWEDCISHGGWSNTTKAAKGDRPKTLPKREIVGPFKSIGKKQGPVGTFKPGGSMSRKR